LAECDARNMQTGEERDGGGGGGVRVSWVFRRWTTSRLAAWICRSRKKN
jgi:hypothetical protein